MVTEPTDFSDDLKDQLNIVLKNEDNKEGPTFFHKTHIDIEDPPSKVEVKSKGSAKSTKRRQNIFRVKGAENAKDFMSKYF